MLRSVGHRRCRLCVTGLKQTGNSKRVQDKDRHHQDDQKCQTKDHQFFLDLGCDRFSEDPFVGEEHHVASIQYRNRKEVHDGEIRAQQRQEKQQARGAFRGFGRCHQSDGTRASKVGCRDFTGHQFAKKLANSRGIRNRLFETELQGFSPGLLR